MWQNNARKIMALALCEPAVCCGCQRNEYDRSPQLQRIKEVSIPLSMHTCDDTFTFKCVTCPLVCLVYSYWSSYSQLKVTSSMTPFSTSGSPGRLNHCHVVPARLYYCIHHFSLPYCLCVHLPWRAGSMSNSILYSQSLALSRYSVHICGIEQNRPAGTCLGEI